MDGTRRASCEDYLARGYHPGSIVRVAMRNFLTYSDAVAYPGPELNVVLGPNGTGKSALTHAICLACGGAPKSIGRSDDIKQFVKRNSEAEGKSYCEVDILTRDSVRTVRRTINSENKSSSWTMGGRPSTQKDVKEFMATMNIDVDNLNSFMPQDKVGSFTQQTPQGILQKTLQSIDSGDGSGRTLADEQEELAQHQSSTRVKENEVKAKRMRVQTLTAELQSMEGEVQRMRQRTELKELYNLYKIKLAVVEALSCEEMVKEKQEVVDAATARLNDAQAVMQPLETKVRDLKRDAALHEKQVQGAMKQLDKTEASILQQQNELEECSLRMDNTVMALDSLDASRRQLQERLRSAKEEVGRIQQLKAEAEEQHPAHLAQLQKLNEELREADNAASEAANELNSAEIQRTEKREQISTAQRIINNYSDPKLNFLRKCGKFKDVPKVYDWIQNNRHAFKGEVIGPVGMHIKVDDPAIARMVESSVAPKRMMTFLAEFQEDYDLINRELRARQNLKFTLVKISNTENMSGSFSTRQLRDFGHTCGGTVHYLNDAVPAPSHMPVMVRAFLQSFTMLHKIIYVKPDPRSNIDVSKLPAAEFDILCENEPRFSLFTIERDSSITKVAGTKSQYNRSAPATIVSSDANNNYYLQIGNADKEGELAEKKAALDNLIGDIKVIDTRYSHAFQRSNELAQRCQDIRRQKTLCQSELKVLATYTRQLESEQRRIADLERQLSTSAESEREGHKRTLLQEVQNYQKHLEALNKKVRSGTSQAVNHAVSVQRLREIREKYHSAERELVRARDGLEDLQRQKSLAENERNETKEKLEELEHMLKELEVSSGGRKKFEKLYAKCVQECPEDTYLEIEMRISEIGKIIERSMENKQLLDKYEETKAALANEEAALKELSEQLQQSEEKIEDRLAAWKDKVKNLERKLNTLFAKFMEELNYHGQVCLREIGGLDTYEMQMNVSFRGESDIAPLSGQRHSGGERAVATIMYLMALQGLTSAPFRVVDEINQGMDERNERLVFDIIVRNSCVSKEERLLNALAYKPQYFLVSPKLLQGLRAMESDGVTVLMIWNGPGVIPFQVGDVVRRLRDQKRGRSAEDNDEEHNEDLENGSVTKKRA